MKFPTSLALAIAMLISPAMAADKPNVLFIAIDDLNDWTGALKGHPQSVTPNLDRLADSGVLFTNTHCAAPACNPSRASLMTGIRPSTSGVYFNSQPWRKSTVLGDAKTLPQWFKQHGYSAQGAGKIYHGGFEDASSWDQYWPSLEKSKPGDPRPAQLPANGIPNTSHFDWGPLPNGDEEMGDWQVAEWISGQLAVKRDKPFFLACGFYRPHLPWFAPQKYFDKFPLDSIQLPDVPEDDLSDIPEAGIKMAKPDGDHAKVLKHDQWKQAVQGYLANVNFVDTCLGKVLDALEKSEHSENTIVVLWSDHGWHLGEKQHWRKFSLWEEATRVQMMWRVPGVTKAEQRCYAPTNLLDIYPTLVDLCGLETNPALEGNSLRPLLKNPATRWEQPSITTHGRNNHSARGNQFRYIRYEDGSEELYDHKSDPMELTNLASDEAHSEVKAQMAKSLPETNVPLDPKGRNSKGGKKK